MKINKKVSKHSKLDKKLNEMLHKSIKTKTIDESSLPFARLFYKTLLEQGEEIPLDVADDVPPAPVNSPDALNPEKNKEDFQNTLEPTTQPDEFDTEGVNPNVTAEQINKVKDWAGKLDEFSNFLNNPDDRDSLHRILADGDKPGSLIRGVTRKASDSITRIAGEVEKLKEVLNSFVIMAPKKARDLEIRQ
jgi:hypothetical protein